MWIGGSVWVYPAGALHQTSFLFSLDLEQCLSLVSISVQSAVGGGSGTSPPKDTADL